MQRQISPYWISVGFLIATSVGLLLHMGLVMLPAFRDLTHLTLPDARLTGYEPADVGLVIEALRQAPEAAALFRGLHLVPDMIFPAAFTLLSLMLLGKFAPGATVFHKPLHGYRLWIVLAVPLLYAACDYAENIISLMIFPPAQPAPDLLAQLSGVLPFATRSKAMFFFVSLIFIFRFSVFREKRTEQDEAKSKVATK